MLQIAGAVVVGFDNAYRVPGALSGLATVFSRPSAAPQLRIKHFCEFVPQRLAGHPVQNLPKERAHKERLSGSERNAARLQVVRSCSSSTGPGGGAVAHAEMSVVCQDLEDRVTISLGCLAEEKVAPVLLVGVGRCAPSGRPASACSGRSVTCPSVPPCRAGSLRVSEPMWSSRWYGIGVRIAAEDEAEEFAPGRAATSSVACTCPFTTLPPTTTFRPMKRHRAR